MIELKNTEFRPEYTGKLNFYLSAVDDMLRSGSTTCPSASCFAMRGTG
ncbi:MAG: DUF1016 domain-containing protein [Oscillospiraceae bacterium]|jgi:hypothetical protein|nr:DUF1016 domain-containing protein [Oscillospiraceae bacterium]